MKNSAIRVMIIDDHPLLRQGLTALINAQKEFTVVAEIGDSRQVVETVKKTNPSLAILDLSLNGVSGIEVLKDLKIQIPELKVLILSMHDEKVYAPRAVRSGAMGYVMKQESPEVVIAALHRIHEGQVYLSPSMSNRVLNSLATGQKSMQSPIEILSDRELEILGLIGNGISTREIAKKLNVSVKTVESHRSHIKDKLNLADAMKLVHYAVQWVAGEASPNVPTK